MKNYVESIEGENFKGRSFKFSLCPVSVFCGDNSLGKTGASDAIKILTVGYSPRHGKAAAKTFGFCGSPAGAASMSVRGIVGGKLIERTWQSKKGKITFSGFEGEIIPPVMMDANEWIKKSGPEKTRFVFNLIDLSTLGFSTEKITARLKADVKVEQPDEISERVLNEVIESVGELAEFRDHEKQTYQEWIDAIIEHFKSTRDKANAVVGDMEGAIGAGTQLRAQEGLNVNQNVTADLESARAAYTDAIANYQTLARKQSEYNARSRRRQDIETAIAGFVDNSGKIRDQEILYVQQSDRLQAYRSNTASLVAGFTRAQAEEMACRKSVRDKSAEIETLRASLETDLKGDRCPYCKSKGKGWKDALSESVNEQIAVIQKKIDDLTARQQAAQADIDKIGPILEASKKSDAANDQLRADNFILGKEIANAKRSQAEFEQHKARLSELADLGEAVNHQSIIDANGVAEEKRKCVVELEGQERQQIANMQDAKRTEQARQAHAEKLIEVEVYKLALKVMQAIQGEMMEAAFAGFMEKMNLIADGIFPGGKLVFHDGEIGYFAGAAFVGLSYFGGTEEMLAFAGLSLTLAQASPIKIIIMDELGRIAPARRVKLIERMFSLIRQGVIDQFIGIDVDGGSYGSFRLEKDFELINLDLQKVV